MEKLCVSPYALETWPLFIAPRTLSVLALILLGRQESCRGPGDECDDTSCVIIWQKLLRALREMSLTEKCLPGDTIYFTFYV